MDLHIILRPKNHPTINTTIKAGYIQFNRFEGPILKALGTNTIWWKNKFVHARAHQSHSVVTLDIPPNLVARQLHSGFSLEILKNNIPVFYGDWTNNYSLNNGFQLRINLEEIQKQQRNENTRLAIIFPRQPGLHPSNQEVYDN